MSLETATRDPALETQLAEHLAGVRIGHPVHAYQSVESTMAAAHELAEAGGAEGTLVWAARQEQGRGRLGRSWISPTGGVYCSLIVRPTRAVTEIPQLSLVAGLAAAHTIQDVTHLYPRIRWPNDVLLDDRKVAGILIEAKNGAVVVGFGLNVNTRQEALPEGAASFVTAGADPYSLYRVTGALCRRFQAWYEAWTAQGFAPIRTALRPWIGLFGQPVHITAGSDRHEGTSQDLDESGRLLVRLDSGVVHAFDMGEVTVLR